MNVNRPQCEATVRLAGWLARWTALKLKFHTCSVRKTFFFIEFRNN